MDEEFVVIRRRAAPPAAGRRPRLVAAGSASRPPESLIVEILAGTPNLATIRADPSVETAAPSIPLKLIAPVTKKAVTVTPDAADPASAVVWGVRAVGADTSRFDGSGIVVAVLDTGIKRDHPAFKDVPEVIERDFTGDGNGDVDGHGTHCAGTIFGRDVNSMRIGIARGVTKALIGKVVGKQGAPSARVVSAIQWAIENGAHVISMSLGVDFPGYQRRLEKAGLAPEPATSKALEGYRLTLGVFDSISLLVDSLTPFHQPCLLIAATGNESRRGGTPPFEIAASPPSVSRGFVAVGALAEGPNGMTAATFANTGGHLCGPGVDIISAGLDNGLVSMDGTSMATPHVAGVAALWAQRLKAEKKLSLPQLSAQLHASAVTTVLAPGFSFMVVGAGLVQAPQ